MKIRLRYFGMIADRLGKTSEEVEWEGSPNPIDPRAWLLQLHPVLAEMSWKVAVDQEIVDGVCLLHENSEIVVLPPFAGG
jgi:molybdopterin converting factor small subunit